MASSSPPGSLYGIPDLSEARIQVELRQWAKRCKSLQLNIIVAGVTGVGKSSLINSLVGYEAAEEGEESNSGGKTTEVAPYRETINGIDVTLWDTPGLQDALGMDNSEAIQKIRKVCTKVDLLVYCSQMTDRRVTTDTINTVSAITHAFGEDMWQNAVYALTFANEIHPQPGSKVTKEAYFLKRLTDLQQAVRKALKEKNKIAHDTVDQLPIVPIGYRECVLPDRPDWVTAFWKACYYKTKKEAQSSLLGATKDRFAPAEGVCSQEEEELDPHQRPVVTSRYNDDKMPKLLGAAEDSLHTTHNHDNRSKLPQSLPYTQSQEYDIFLSFAGADNNFAENVREKLVTLAKLTVFMPSEDLMPGRVFSDQIASMIKEGCRKTIVILSPDYLRSEWCGYEARLAHLKSPACKKGSLIPILYRKCQVPDFMAYIHYLDYPRYCENPQELQKFFWERLYKTLNKKE